jgi:LasA protease
MMNRKLILLFMGVLYLLSACASPLWGGDVPESTPPLVEEQPTQVPSPTVTLPPSPVPSETPTVPPPTRTPSPSPVPFPTATASVTLAPINIAGPMLLYPAQGGDTLPALATRFGVSVEQISADAYLPYEGLLDPGTLLVIPKIFEETGPKDLLVPDSEVVYSPSTLDFEIATFVRAHGGYLSTRSGSVYTGSRGWLTGADVVQRVGLDNSINPRILLALMEYESNWLRSQPRNAAQEDYPLGYRDFQYKGLYRQLTWAVQQLSAGYYGWRTGSLTELRFRDGVTVRLAPTLNAGTVAVHYFFAQTRTYAEWQQAVNPQTGFLVTYKELFGDPAQQFEPILPAGLAQPEFILPFERGVVWSYSGGPHAAWEAQDALAALDFAPGSQERGCVRSDEWVVAVADGRVVRSEPGLVVLDLDGDGYEQTGWNILYLHVRSDGRPQVGTQLRVGDRVGHPSCEGGFSTGTHVHIARKYNGEWMLADGPIPFVMSGWRARNGDEPYKGFLTRGEQTVIACTCGVASSQLKRD